MSSKIKENLASFKKVPFLSQFFGDKKNSGGKKTAAQNQPKEVDPLEGLDLATIGGGLDASTLPKAPLDRGPAKIRPVLKVHPTLQPTKLLPIVLSTRRAAWRRDEVTIISEITPENVAKQVKKRDKGSCRYCGFVDHIWNEIHILDAERGGDEPSNLVTVCHLRRLCWDVGQAGVTESGVLIWAPSIRQRDLNDVVRALWVAEMDGGLQSDGAKALNLTLLEAQRGAYARLQTSNPLVLANSMVSLPDDEYARRGDKLEGIRLLNVGKHMLQGTNHLSEVVKSWVAPKGAFAKRPSKKWDDLLQKAKQEISGAAV